MSVKISAEAVEVGTTCSRSAQAQHQSAVASSMDLPAANTPRHALRPAMVAAIDLDQFAVALAPRAGLMKTPALLAATATVHPPPSLRVQVSRGVLDAILREQNLRRQARTRSLRNAVGPARPHTRGSRRSSWLFEVRPRALWIIAPPPPSRYATTSRRVCRVLSPRIAAAETSVQRLAKTSERTSMRRSSCPLMLKRSNLRLRHLSEG